MSVSILPLAFALLASVSAQDPAGPAPAFLEVRAARVAGGAALAPGEPVFAGEAIRVEVRAGFERTLLAERMLPLFRRELDVQAELRPPWAEEIAGANWAPAAEVAPGPGSASLVIGGAAGRARWLDGDERAGQRYAVLAVERILIVQVGEALRLPSASLRFAWASRFESDLVRGAVPLDRRDEFLEAAPTPRSVLPLPEEGRPPDFSGAVGRFRLAVRLAAPSLAEGEGCVIELELTGEGDLDGGALPRLDDVPGLHVLGWLERRESGRRLARIELLALAAAPPVLPPLTFAFFDPVAPAGYRRARTEPLELPFAPVAPPPPPPQSPPPFWPFWLVATALIVGGAWAWLRRGRRPPARSTPSAESRPAAPASDPARALEEALAGLLGRVPAAIAPSELPAALVAAGVAPDLAARLSSALQAVAAARYGGAAAPAPAGLAALLAELRDLLTTNLS